MQRNLSQRCQKSSYVLEVTANRANTDRPFATSPALLPTCPHRYLTGFSGVYEGMNSVGTALLLVGGLLTAQLQSAAALDGFTLTGENWTYEPGDGGGTITGILSKPATNGLLPAVVIGHGKGGTASGFSLPKARVMTNWGLVCIGPNYTHAGSGSTPDNEGWCPENDRRARACLTILASLGYVDTNRVAAYGNSMGAFVTAGFCGAVGSQIRAATITAGGCSGTTDTSFASPAVQEVQGITAPFLMLHGTADTTVPPAQSATLQAILSSNARAQQPRALRRRRAQSAQRPLERSLYPHPRLVHHLGSALDQRQPRHQ